MYSLQFSDYKFNWPKNKQTKSHYSVKLPFKNSRDPQCSLSEEWKWKGNLSKFNLMFSHQRILLEEHDLYIWQMYSQQPKKYAINEQPNSSDSKE